MKKRNVIIAAAVTAVIGSGIAFAGAKQCRDAGAGWHGNFGENKIEHIVDRLDSHLDLTDQQELSLRSILEENKAEFFDAHQARKSFRLEIMQLDPSSSDYDAAVASLADEFAAQVRQKTLQAAEIVKQASAVLTDEQLQKARDLIEQRMDKYGHHKVDGNSQS
jgi:Spy/CpxP family protein refolding chaperone